MTLSLAEMLAAVAAVGLLACGTFFLRLLPRLRRDPWLGTEFPLKGFTGDSMVHLVIADLIRRNGHRIIREAPRFLFGVHFDYPALFHKLVSYLPKRVVDRWDWVFTPAIDAFHVTFVFGIAWYVLGAHLGVAHPLAAAFLAASAFALTPLFTTPDRQSSIGERPLGFLFGHAYFVGTALWIATGDWGWLALAVAAGSCAAATSKFAIQAMTFITIAMALVGWTWRPLLVLLCMSAFALIASRFYVLRVVRGLVRHSTFYARQLMHFHDYVRSFGDHMLAAGFRQLLRGRPRAAWAEIERHPVGRILQRVPWLVPLVVASIVMARAQEPVPAMAATLLAWAWAAMLVGVLTSLSALKFLGEGFRYLEFAILPMVLAVFLVPAHLGGPAWLLLAIPGLLLYVRAAGKPAAFDAPSAEARQLVDHFAERPPATIFAIPGRLTFPLCYGTEHRGVWLLTNVDVGERGRNWASFFTRSGIYPYPDPACLPTLRERFGADLLVMWKEPARFAETVWKRPYDVSSFPKLFENAQFAVYDLVPAPAPASPLEAGPALADA